MSKSSRLRELLLNSDDKNPLIIRGARQVGKTWLMKEFGKRYYKKTAYVNFDNNKRLYKIFEDDYDIERIIIALQVETKTKIVEDETLIIFDEIQECPKALTSLKYFCEHTTKYDIIAAGSLLGVATHEGTGFPVGKVDFIDLYPLSFFEFARALGEEQLVELVEKQDYKLVSAFKFRFEDLLKKYCYIGGMPAVVMNFIKNKDFAKVRAKQKSILSTYEEDFSKHIPQNTATNLQAKSLKVYIEKYKPDFAIRTSMADYKNTENLIDIPLYSIEGICH